MSRNFESPGDIANGGPEPFQRPQGGPAFEQAYGPGAARFYGQFGPAGQGSVIEGNYMNFPPINGTEFGDGSPAGGPSAGPPFAQGFYQNGFAGSGGSGYGDYGQGNGMPFEQYGQPGSGPNGQNGPENWSGSNGPGAQGNPNEGFGGQGQGEGSQFGAHGRHHHGHHHHGMMSELNQDLTGNNALTSDEKQTIQGIEQKTAQQNQPTEQDLRLQNATLTYDLASGNTSGAQTAEQAISADQTTMLTNRMSEFQSVYNALNPDQQKALLSGMQQQQSELSSQNPQSGSPQDMRSQMLNLQIALAQGDSSSAQTAQQAIASDQSSILSNRVNMESQRFSNFQSNNPNAFQQFLSSLQNRVTDLTPSTTSTDTSTTDQPPIAT